MIGRKVSIPDMMRAGGTLNKLGILVMILILSKWLRIHVAASIAQ